MWRKRKNKYNAKKIEYDGHVFDSKKEFIMYQELKLLEKGKRISNLRLQPKFVLQRKGKNYQGKAIREISYYADFMFFDVDQKRTRVIDCKGFKTEVYRIKKKMFDYINRDILFLEETL